MPNDFMSQWQEAGRELLAAAPTTINEQERSVDCLWYSGADIERIAWDGSTYLLHFDPAGADLSLLNASAPVLDNHNSYRGAAGQLGKVERAWRSGTNFFATLRFSQRPEVNGIWTDIATGISTHWSMGVELLEVSEKRDANGRLTLKTALRWRAFEISVCPIPADFSTTTLSSNQMPAWLIAANLRSQQIERLGGRATQFTGTEREEFMQTNYSNREALSRIDAAAREVAQRNPALSKEQAMVQAINANKKLYDDYLAACPEQTGRR